jgi:hypothetical protein
MREVAIQKMYSTGTLAVLLVLLTILGGCQDREIAMSILNVRPFDMETCSPISDDNVFQTSGTIDMALRNTYSATLKVESNLVDIPSSKGFRASDNRVSTNAILLRSATIEFSTLDQLSAQIPPKRSIPLSGTLNEGTDLLLTGVEFLDANTLDQIRNSQEFISTAQGEAKPVRTSITLLARIRLSGETLDGREAESNEFLYPIEVCNGCRVSYPADLVVQRGGALTCPPPSADSEDSDTELTCTAGIGMDSMFADCRTCQGIAVDSFARQLCQPPRTP